MHRVTQTRAPFPRAFLYSNAVLITKLKSLQHYLNQSILVKSTTFHLQGAEVNSTTDYDGRTALHIACVEGNTEAVKFLLKHGASTQVRDRFNSSPLDDAINFRHKEIVKTLRKAGAQLMKTSMETAVELCRLAAKNRVDDLLVWQLAGVDLNACDYDKRTPLHVVSVGREILISPVASAGPLSSRA